MSVVHAGTLHIGRGNVHVWTTWLDLAEEAVRCLWSILSDDERGRAARFVRPEDQRKFVVARGTLRRLLGLYLGRRPAAVRLGYSERGKPFVEDGAGTTFNLSHSGELALYAIASGRRVGIDVETTRPGPDLESVARQLVSPSEWAVLQTLEGPRRQEALLECWVRKEAYVKARGDGLYFGLERFAVTVKPGDPARLLTVGEPGEADRWQLRALVPAAGYTAALAVEGSNWQLATWTWPERLQDHVQSAPA